MRYQERKKVHIFQYRILENIQSANTLGLEEGWIDNPSNKGFASICRWEVIKHSHGYCFLRGKVFDHKELRDGLIIETSRLENINFKNLTAETQNTIYFLS